ncbi:hypothetical protein BH23DEI1_BH23DEI1_22320 [soil metagenome]
MRVNLPFADCDLAELHMADSIQPFGAMLVLDDQDVVVALSTNVDAYLVTTAQSLLGTDARTSLPPGIDLAAVRAEAPVSTGNEAVRLHLRTVSVAHRSLSLAAHARGSHLVLEFADPGAGDASLNSAANVVQRLTNRLEEADEPADVAGVLMNTVADLTGFDRTMLYRFLPEWHGEVLDERLAEGLEGFRGRRFPAGDIPENARRLYRLKRQRIIADARATPVPVVGVQNGMTLDLTGSELRAVHPVHLEYLANMGVVASFSVSIVTRGQLWGMIACHHRSPRVLEFVTRQACEMAATIASLHIANLERASHLRELDRLRADLARIWSEAERNGRIDIRAVMPHLRSAFQADGAVACRDGVRHTDGAVPTPATLERLHAVCTRESGNAVHSWSRVPTELIDDPEAARVASGLLYLPLGRDASLTLLRHEQVESVEWAGRPPDDGTVEPRREPRTSFAVWREATRGHANPWSAAALEAAGSVRNHLVDERTRAVLELRASTDELTGLANRATFLKVVRERLADALRSDVVLLLVDLDGFKQINDTYGHVTGDRLLERVGERLLHVTRDADVTARLGGDEFAIVMHRVASVQALSAAAARIVASLGAPYHVGDQTLTVSASVGGAFALADDSSDTLVQRADGALYDAKDAGRNRFVIATEVDAPRDHGDPDTETQTSDDR